MKKLNRKEIKKKAHIFLRGNYFMAILIIFLFNSILNNNYNYATKMIVSSDTEKKEIEDIFYDKETNTYSLKNASRKELEENSDKLNGVLAPIVRRLGVSNSPLYNFAYTIKIFTVEKNIGKGTFSLLIGLISLFIYLFVKLILDIGKNRFYLESRLYKKTNVTKLLFPYKIKGTIHLSIIMYLRRIYTILWSLTIIGGIIKTYEYLLIPYILAENPMIERKEAFKLSKEMMMGYKKEAFIMDLSLIGWELLCFFTFNLVGMLYFDAYREFIYAEMYYAIRNDKINSLKNKELLNDEYLFNNKENSNIYPESKIKYKTKQIKINSDYNQHYTIRNIILIFFTTCFIGYSWEVMLHIITTGQFVNRGTLFGPWLPIYGFGTILILLLLKPFRDKPIRFIVSIVLLAGTLEYSTSFILEILTGQKWWDYTGYFLNLHGRICLEGLIVFGFGGAIITYFVAPLLNSLFNKVKSKILIIICFILVTLFSIDTIYSIKHPNMGEGITN